MSTRKSDNLYIFMLYCRIVPLWNHLNFFAGEGAVFGQAILVNMKFIH